MVALTLLGLAFRLARLGDTIFGDELSTLYILRGNGLLDALRVVHSDAEITPPLYFLLSWFAIRLGDAPELLRVVSLIAGTASIPLTYLVGARAVGRTAGALAATVMTLSPFMIFYSTDGRAYALAIALVLCSTLAMLNAAAGGGRRWWAAYAAASCLAMYSHYTAGFVLIVQVAWLLWAHPEARRACIAANVVAAVGFAPWLGGFVADLNSPTTDILSALQGDGFTVKRLAFENWAYGYPYFDIHVMPGQLARVMLAVAAPLTALAALTMLARSRLAGVRLGPGPEGGKGVVLVFALAVAAPGIEALMLLLGGSDLLGARNMNLSSAGLALSIGTVIAAAGPLLGTIGAVAIIGGYSIGAVKTLPVDASVFDGKSASAYIESAAEPGDPVLDFVPWGYLTPVPLTSFNVYLPASTPLYSLYLPLGPPPFLSAPLPDDDALIAEAFARTEGDQAFLVAPPARIVTGGRRQAPEVRGDGTLVLPYGASVVERHDFAGMPTLQVAVVRIERQPGTWLARAGAGG